MPTPSAMMLRGLQMIGDKASTVTALTTAEDTLWLPVMNAMLDAWSIEPLMVYALRQDSFALTASTGSYTIGPGGAFQMSIRPTNIVDPCFVRDANNMDSRVDVVNAEAYGRIISKTLDGQYPEVLYYEKSFPLGRVHLYGEPASGLTLYISTPQVVTKFDAPGTNYTLPPGYQEAIESNFAVRAAMGYLPCPQDVTTLARTSKATIKSANVPDSFMRLDAGLVAPGLHSNIFTGP